MQTKGAGRIYGGGVGRVSDHLVAPRRSIYRARSICLKTLMHVEEMQVRGRDAHGRCRRFKCNSCGSCACSSSTAGCRTGAGPARPSMLTETHARA
jgi:hypothetical protein